MLFYKEKILKMKTNQKGFSAVTVLLALLIIGVIGGVGYYVYNAQKKSNNPDLQSSKSQKNNAVTEKAQETKDETINWTLLNSGLGGFSIKIPDGWTVINMSDSNAILSQNIEYIKGQKAKIETVKTGGSDQTFRFSIMQFKDGDDYQVLDGDEQKTEFIAGDLKGTKYYKKYPLEKVGGLGPYPGMESYKYEFKKAGTTTYISYNIFNYNEYSKDILTIKESDPNRINLIDQVAKTLKVN
jgi:hypothetical protein